MNHTQNTNMLPIFFPFTYMPASVADVLAASFDRMVMLAPSQSPIGPDRPEGTHPDSTRPEWLTIEAPFDAGDTALAAALKAYREWGQMHGYTQLKQFVMQKNGNLFGEDLPIHRLKDEIRTHLRAADGPGNDADRMDSHGEKDALPGRIFLAIAEEFDRKNVQIHQDLDRVADMENNLWRSLHGADGDFPFAQPVAGKPGAFEFGMHMPLERLAAWTLFLMHDRMADARIFVTTSAPVADCLAGVLPSSEPLASFAGVPAGPVSGGDCQVANPDAARWRKDFSAWLIDQTTVTGSPQISPPLPPRIPAEMPAVTLKIYRAPFSPRQWFCRAVEKESLRAAPEIPATAPATVVVRVDPNDD